MPPLSSSSSRGEAHRAHVPHEENEPDLVLVCAPLSADETVTAARRRQTAHADNTVRTKQRNEDEQEEEEEKEKKKKQARLFFVFVATTIVIAARDSFSRQHKLKK
jgi:Icc-related predicted phosphoesterase